MIKIRTIWASLKQERTRVLIAVITWLVFGVLMIVAALIKGRNFVMYIYDFPLVLRPFVYAFFGLSVWSGFCIFDRILPHAFRRNAPIWIRMGWVVFMILLLPFGPTVYYLLVYRRNPAD